MANNIGELEQKAEKYASDRLYKIVSEKGNGVIRQISDCIDVNETTFSRQVSGKRKLTANIIRRLCITYGINAGWLLGLPGECEYHSTVNLESLTYMDICKVLLKLEELGIIELYVEDYGQIYADDGSGEYVGPEDPKLQYIRITDDILHSSLSQYIEAKTIKNVAARDDYQATNDSQYSTLPLINWNAFDSQTIQAFEDEIATAVHNNNFSFDVLKTIIDKYELSK